MQDLDLVCVPQFDATVWPTNNHVVADCALGDVGRWLASRIGGGLTGIAKGDAAITADDEIPLHRNPPGAHPNEDGGASTSAAASDIAEKVSAEGPVLKRHHVDGRNVVTPQTAKRPVESGYSRSRRSTIVFQH